ncbi:hypothetical protein [Pseudomonas cichorii]|uniref:hypothetical protein n=1 Tax=Pseudomonas cichorii TaxID=36746 RepID=UPI000EFE3163|nr:hypothetical protein [Pseudomonas cichorii]
MPSPQTSMIIGFLLALVLVIPFVLSLRRTWIANAIRNHSAVMDGNTRTEIEDLKNDLAKAERELFHAKANAWDQIKALQFKLHDQVSSALRFDTTDLKTLYRHAAILTLAAETFSALKANKKATEARKAAQECIDLAAKLKAKAHQAQLPENAA